MDATDNGEQKLSSAKSIGFRPGPLRGKIDALYADLLKQDSGLRISDILRDGVTAFWPQIEAYLRARQATKLDGAQLAQLTVICAKAQEMGVSPEELELQLDALIEKGIEKRLAS